jgi:uncharacterized membrane protein YkoI
MRKPVVIATVVALAGLVGGGIAAADSRIRTDPAPERRNEARYTESHRAKATVTQADAERSAQARHPGTLVNDTHLESEGGHGLRWEVKPDDGHTVWEVQVDAATGKVVSDHPDE